MKFTMRLILLTLFITLPYFSQAQGQGQEKRFRIKIGLLELLNDVVPPFVDLPARLDRFMIRLERQPGRDDPPATYIVQVGEEEHTFTTDGEYHEIIFTHDIQGLVVSILDEKRNRAGRSFILRRRR